MSSGGSAGRVVCGIWPSVVNVCRHRRSAFEADAAATQLGADDNHVWTAFGPTNVSIHKTTVAMELGDVQRAIAIGTPLDTGALPIERQVRHAIETARALARWNCIDDALGALLDAEVIGPDQVRYHRLSRDLVRDILIRPRPPRLAVELSERMGVRSGGPRW